MPDMHKKASAEVYLFLLVIVAIISLSSLSYTITSVNSKRDETIGMSSVSLIKAYDEGEKIKLYFYFALKKAKEEAIANLNENGGYSEDVKCSLNPMTGDNIQLKNICPELDITSNFEKQLNLEMQKYIKYYKSQYQEAENEHSLAALYENDAFSIAEAYTKLVRRAKIKDISISSKIKVVFKPITLLIEDSPRSHYIIEPKFSLPAPDLSKFEAIHSVLADCLNQKKNAESCANSILLRFPGAEISKSGNLLKINADSMKIAIQIQSS